MSARLVAVGDSFSCGVGIGLRIPRHETWVGLLAEALGLRMVLHAAPGSATGEVVRDQLPDATARRAELATLLVGLNDIVRTAFDPAATRSNVRLIVDELCAAHELVLVARLHDAVARLPIPHRLWQHYASRIAEVNRALDDAIADHGNAVLLDLAEIPALHSDCAWAVDRIHPSRYGHHAVASAALCALRATHRPVVDLTALEVPPERVTRLDEIAWFVAHGGPWLARRLPKVVSGRSADEGRRGEGDVLEPLGGGRPARSEQLVHR